MFQKIFQIACCATSVILNSILIFLIITKSPKKLGAYKYLMVYICVFEFIYSVWDMISEPKVHSYNSAFVVFREFTDGLFDREQSFILIVTYCGCFGFSMAIFGVHFIYRYGAVNIEFGNRFTSGKKVISLFIIPLWYGFWWAMVCYIYFRFDDVCDEYMRKTFIDEYLIEAKDTSYICVLFHRPDDKGIEHPDVSIFGGIACCWFMILSSMLCVFYFGIRCYFQIRKSISNNSTVSLNTKALQRQLFHALVIQTFIPLVLMYIPIGILFLFPMIKYKLFFKTNFVAYTIAAYPAIDPLPNMIIIKCYRKAITGYLRKVLKMKPTAKVHMSEGSRSADQRTDS
ncbi:unnamed protein product [Caenorhabditis angaria]|uniref:Serpentine receptor class r-10 n=1 Tax=Caenorhabditis angaria TaxID=860376 RepID=A0A9P1IMR9_9PELO|nr:unnamed protein product [Caenorhabditis angaria]